MSHSIYLEDVVLGFVTVELEQPCRRDARGAAV